MGPWKHDLLTIHLKPAHGTVDVHATLAQTAPYPHPDDLIEPHISTLDQRSLPEDDVLPWATSLHSKVAPPDRDHVVHLRIVITGSPALRPPLFALPWSSIIPGAIVTFSRGRPPQRPRLGLPIQLSTTRSRGFLEERLDDFVKVDAVRAFTIRPQGHVVHMVEGDRLDNQVAARTRLLIVETSRLDVPPNGPFSVLQIAAPAGACIELARRFYRGIFHDAPLDACLHAAAHRAHVALDQLRLDLYEGDEHALRPRRALIEAAESIKSAKPHLPKKGAPKAANGGHDTNLESYTPPPVHAEPPSADVLEVVSNVLADKAKYLDFTYEKHGVNDAVDYLGTAGPAIDTAEASRAIANDIELDRSAQVWLESSGNVVPAETPLVLGATYDLKFQIASEIRPHATVAKLDNERLRVLLDEQPYLDLHVILFADPSKVTLATRYLEVRLQRWGATTPVGTTCVPRQSGVHQIRACIYYRGNLLESLVLRVGVDEPGEDGRIDYSAVESFAGVTQLPEVTYSVWINDAGDDHWIGVHVCGEGTLGDLESCDLNISRPGKIAESAPPVRAALELLEGVAADNQGSYRFSELEAPTDEAVQLRDKLLVGLAAAGRTMFDNLLNKRRDIDPAYLDALKAQLKRPDRTLSIARIDDETNVPWALMYDHRLDPAAELTLCTRHRNKQPDGSAFAMSPAACRSQPDCPLGDPASAAETVCPFGFWGFRHKLELRLRPAAGRAAALDRTRIEVAGKPRAAAAMYAFDESPGHLQALGEIIDAGDALMDRTAVLKALAAGDRSLYYFFCHAEKGDTQPIGLRLKLAENQLLVAGSLPSRSDAAEWEWNLGAWDQHRPLVFLNACKSIALDATLVSPFVDGFIDLGASALVGTEVQVFTELAASTARELLRRMVALREDLGTALLHVRRAMLGAGNPMGLAYAAYGSTALHFHFADCACAG